MERRSATLHNILLTFRSEVPQYSSHPYHAMSLYPCHHSIHTCYTMWKYSSSLIRVTVGLWIRLLQQAVFLPSYVRLIRIISYGSVQSMVVSVSLLQDHFSNNDILGVRVRFFWHSGYSKGEVRVICRSKVLEKWSSEKWGTTQSLCHLKKNQKMRLNCDCSIAYKNN